MKNRFLGILLLISFWAVMIKPFVPFIQYYVSTQENIVKISDQCDCDCPEETAKMASNGDAYLKALLKRVCDDDKKETPKIPVINIPVFVKTLIGDYNVVYKLPENNYHKISDFIIQPDINSFIEELLRPPTLS